MIRRYIGILVILTLGSNLFLQAQQAGEYTYDFLNLTNSARVAALGGNQVGMTVNNLNLVFHNPAALNSNLHQHATFNFVPYISDIRYGYAGYARHFNTIGTFSLGVHNVNYGDFDLADEDGNINGSFSAAEYAIHLAYGKALSPRLNAGIAVKPIISNFENYSSLGLTADIGMLYKSADSLFSAGITLKNVGSQLKAYNETIESVPTDLQIGISRKLRHAPFRFSITAQHLLDWDTKYEVKDGNGDVIEDAGNSSNNFDQLMRHMVLGLEFLPAKNFYVGFGYNHRRRKELGIDSKMSTVGWSWGFGFRVYKFHFAYGSARYHLAGSSNHFSITTDLSAF